MAILPQYYLTHLGGGQMLNGILLPVGTSSREQNKQTQNSAITLPVLQYYITSSLLKNWETEMCSLHVNYCYAYSTTSEYLVLKLRKQENRW